MTFSEWLEFGLKMNWISYPDCITHNPMPYTSEELAEDEEGYDFCVVASRVWGEQGAPDELIGK